MKHPIITHEQALVELSYDKETGSLFHANPTHPKFGQRADYPGTDGYRMVRALTRNYGAHRMAFFLVEGRWPTPQIDHINRVRDDNRWENLREATHSENQRNKGPNWTKTQTNMGVMRYWMKVADTSEQRILAEKSGTSVGMLRQYAGGHRQVSASMAGVFEAVTAEMHRLSKGRLPKITRTDVCEACRACSYAAKCLGSRAVVSDFPIVDARQLELAL